jgi:hypothetical protein
MINQTDGDYNDDNVGFKDMTLELIFAREKKTTIENLNILIAQIPEIQFDRHMLSSHVGDDIEPRFPLETARELCVHLENIKAIKNLLANETADEEPSTDVGMAAHSLILTKE